MASAERLVEAARASGAAEEREFIRSVIDNTSFGIAALEVLEEGESAVASRAVASYGRLLLQMLDARSSNPATTDRGRRGTNTSEKFG
jgi:hypothetical protein